MLGTTRFLFGDNHACLGTYSSICVHCNGNMYWSASVIYIPLCRTPVIYQKHAIHCAVFPRKSLTTTLSLSLFLSLLLGCTLLQTRYLLPPSLIPFPPSNTKRPADSTPRPIRSDPIQIYPITTPRLKQRPFQAINQSVNSINQFNSFNHSINIRATSTRAHTHRHVCDHGFYPHGYPHGYSHIPGSRF